MGRGLDRHPASTNSPRVVAICLSVATLLFARQIAMWGDPRNRFYLNWQRADTLTLILSLFGVALLLYLIAIIVRRVSWGPLLLRWLTIVLLADILVGYAGVGKIADHLAPFAVASVVVASGGLYAASRPGSRFLSRGTSVLVLLAWLAPLSVVQVLLWRPWDVRSTIPGDPPQPGSANLTPVFLFVFDEWSYQRSYDRQELRPFFRHLRQLASHSLEFTDAHSLAGSTNPSVPRLLFQRDGILLPRNGVALWKQGDSTVPSAELPSIFAAAKARGYRTSLIGFYFPYRALLGNQVEHIVNEAYTPKGQRFRERVSWVLARNLEFLADPISQLLWQQWYSSTISQNWPRINYAWRVAVRDLIRGSDTNTFAMIHWPLPHGPYVLNEDGTLRHSFKGARMEGTPADYQRHLAFLDLVLGEAVARLDSAGLLDAALLIVTSDHSWKTDPDSLRAVPGAQTWVPLIIKLPHQQTGYRIPETFCLGQLGALLQGVIDKTLTERTAPRRIVGLPSNATCGGRVVDTAEP